MAEITAQLVKDLRERTGAGMMECKSALTEAKGDLGDRMDKLAGTTKALGMHGTSDALGTGVEVARAVEGDPTAIIALVKKGMRCSVSREANGGNVASRCGMDEKTLRGE